MNPDPRGIEHVLRFLHTDYPIPYTNNIIEMWRSQMFAMRGKEEEFLMKKSKYFCEMIRSTCIMEGVYESIFPRN